MFPHRVKVPLAPFKSPVGDGDDNDDDNWCYGENAGGLCLWFGIYEGHKLHEVPLYYIDWCLENLTSSTTLQNVIPVYLEGVRNFLQAHYSDFIVPFGKKHHGETIGQCRDKPWFLWLTRIRDLRVKYPYFLHAVDLWLANPRHQGVHSDIGEPLDATEYEDDIELMEGLQVDNLMITQEDINFLDDSGLGADDGNESYRTELDSTDDANTSIETDPRDGSTNKEENESQTETEADTIIRGRPKRSRAPRPSPISKHVSPKLRKIIRSKFVREAEYSAHSDDSDDMDSFIDDGPIEGEDDSSEEPSSDSPGPPPVVKEVGGRRKRITKKNHSEGETSFRNGSSSHTRRPRTNRHSRQGVANITKSSTKNTSKRGKGSTRGAERSCSEDGDQKNVEVAPPSRTLRSGATRATKTRKSQLTLISDLDSASDSDDLSLPEVRYLFSPSKPKPKKASKSGTGSQRKTVKKSALPNTTKHRKFVQSSNESASASSEESPRTARQRIRNVNKKNTPDSVSSYGSDESSDEEDTQKKEHNHSRNEIDEILSEVSAKFSPGDGDSPSKRLYPSPPLTDVARKPRKKVKTKQRAKYVDDFIVPDEESADESDDFRATSTSRTTTNPHTPEPPGTHRYSTRTSPRKAVSADKPATQYQTPNLRCYVELPPSRQHLIKKMTGSINKNVSATSRGRLKRTHTVVDSSEEDEPSEQTKRPRISPMRLSHRPKSRVILSDEETVAGSVDGETMIRGSSLGLTSSSPSKSYERSSPSKPRARKRAPRTGVGDDIFKSSQHGPQNKHGKAVQAPE